MTHNVESVPIVYEFANDLPSIRPERDLKFGIALLLDTQPISIPPYIIPLENIRN